MNHNIITTTADTYELPLALVYSIIWQESVGEVAAYRFEPAFHQRIVEIPRRLMSGHTPNIGTLPTLASEKILRASSFGLMQILGETARSILQWKGQYLTELLEPGLNIELGCKLLRKLYGDGEIVRGSKAYDRMLTRYNGSSAYISAINGVLDERRFVNIKWLPKGFCESNFSDFKP